MSKIEWLKPLCFGIIYYVAVVTVASHLISVSPTGLLKRSEIAQKDPMGSHCCKPKLPNPFMSPGLEAKVMRSGSELPELESQPYHAIAK